MKPMTNHKFTLSHNGADDKVNEDYHMSMVNCQNLHVLESSAMPKFELDESCIFLGVRVFSLFSLFNACFFFCSLVDIGTHL